jgi:hypothetical protein
VDGETRRSFNGKLLGSLLTFGLVETLLTRDLLAADAKPLIGKWVVELSELCQSVKQKFDSRAASKCKNFGISAATLPKNRQT